MVKVEQGTIIKINFSPSQGHEQKGYRPALIISTKSFTKNTGFVVACPITHATGNYPLNVNLNNCTKTNGAILCAQIKTLDINNRKYRIIEKVPDEIMRSVMEKIISILDLEHYVLS